jgi:hypothetical protein
MINNDGWNDGDRKEEEVDEEFYSDVPFDEESKGHESIPKCTKEEAEYSLREEKYVVINSGTVIPNRGPKVPYS